jgi:4-hydroxybenzoate polyprenyltransferase
MGHATIQWPFVKDRAIQYARLTRLHRPIGILLLLWPMLWALWTAARGVPDLHVLLVFLLGTVLMRSAGCVINDFADRHFDGGVSRTRDRPLAAGTVRPPEALIVFSVLVLLSGLLVLTMNRLTIGLAFVAVALAAIYPFMKRHTYLPQIYLGAAFGWAVPMAYAAQTGTVPPLAWLIFVATVLWALIYDTEYAMVDREDDLKLGIKSTAILFEDNDRGIIAALQILMICNLALIGKQAELEWPFTLATLFAAALFAYQQWLIREREPAACFAAFLNNNWFGAIVFLGIAASYGFYPG